MKEKETSEIGSYLLYVSKKTDQNERIQSKTLVSYFQYLR